MGYLKKNPVLLFVTVTILTTVTFTAFSGRTRQNPSSDRQKTMKVMKKPEKYFGPVVDYDSQEQISTQTTKGERDARELKGMRYNRRAPKAFGELPEDMKEFGYSSNLTDQLPAIPVKESKVIIRGRVLSSKAFLSPDKTGVYSEFTIKIDEILKYSSTSNISTSNQIVIVYPGICTNE